MHNDITCKHNKGFTLAEILVVLAIISVLVAVSIPIFNGQIKKAQIATNQANIRAAKAAVNVNYMQYETGKYAAYIYDIKTGKLRVWATDSLGTADSNTKKIDVNNKVCAVCSNTVDATATAKNASNRLANAAVNGVYPYVCVAVKQDGTMITIPYYDAASNAILSDTLK